MIEATPNEEEEEEKMEEEQQPEIPIWLRNFGNKEWKSTYNFDLFFKFQFQFLPKLMF